MTVESELEAARLAAAPMGEQTKLKRRLKAAEDRAQQAEMLRGMEALELAEVRKELDDLRARYALLETAVENQVQPDFSAKEVNNARAIAARAQQAKHLAQYARDEAQARWEAAEKRAADAEAQVLHAERHADERARAAEALVKDAQAKAERALAEGFRTGVDRMHRAFIQAVLAQKRGIPEGVVAVLNEDKGSVEEQVADKAFEIVGKLGDLIEDE
jgi:hypothetical protein